MNEKADKEERAERAELATYDAEVREENADNKDEGRRMTREERQAALRELHGPARGRRR